MKIKSIYIDGLHNAVNKTYQFGDIAYLFGNNGAGKSTVLQAIQFALLGYIPGTAKNSREAILRHSPKGSIEVTITLSDTDIGTDIIVNRKLTSKSTEVNTIPGNVYISDIIQDIELPIFNFNEFVGQTANKLKEYFIKNILPTTDGDLDWEKILSESIIDCNFQDRKAIIDYGMSVIDGIDGEILDQVVQANAKFKAEQSFNKTEQQRLQNTIDSLIFYDDYAGPTNINEINSQLLSLGAIRDQLIRYESAASATKTAKDEFDRLEEDINSLGGKEKYDSLVSLLAQLKQQNTALSKKIADMNNELAGLIAIDKASDAIINSKGICPYTKEECKSMVSKIDGLRSDAVMHKAKMIEQRAQIENLSSELNVVQSSIRQCESKIQDYQTIWNRLVTLQKTMSDLPQKPNTNKTIYELDSEIELLTQSKSKLQANIKYNETIEYITKLKFEEELKGRALSAWVKKTDTNGLQTTLMIKPFEELAATMTKYIQNMYGRQDIKAHFNLSTKSNSFSFGLIRDNIYIPYDLLSSGEKCLYTLALMMCITNNSKSPLKLLLCDDIFDHLDANTIETTFTSLKNISNIQFIFAGVRNCENAKDIILKI